MIRCNGYYDLEERIKNLEENINRLEERTKKIKEDEETETSIIEFYEQIVNDTDNNIKFCPINPYLKYITYVTLQDEDFVVRNYMYSLELDESIDIVKENTSDKININLNIIGIKPPKKDNNIEEFLFPYIEEYIKHKLPIKINLNINSSSAIESSLTTQEVINSEENKINNL